LCVGKNQRFLPNVGALSPNQFLYLSRHVRFLKLSSMNIPETLKMPSMGGLGKRPQAILQNQSIRGFFGFESSFQNCFWNLLSTSGLSQIWKIRNVWKLPSPFSRNTLTPCSEKTYWSLKTSFWKKRHV
jgi:hypothetical protein